MLTTTTTTTTTTPLLTTPSPNARATHSHSLVQELADALEECFDEVWRAYNTDGNPWLDENEAENLCEAMLTASNPGITPTRDDGE